MVAWESSSSWPPPGFEEEVQNEGNSLFFFCLRGKDSQSEGHTLYCSVSSSSTSTAFGSLFQFSVLILLLLCSPNLNTFFFFLQEV